MKAIILFSGGLDSTLLLGMALEEKRECICLSIDYNQRHRVELEAAERIANNYGVKHLIVKITPLSENFSPITGGAEGPKDRTLDTMQKDTLSPYYVPARNTLFLSHAMALAEVENADEIWFGANAHDTAFPDCSHEFCTAFQNVLAVASPRKNLKLRVPLLAMKKEDIWKSASALNLPIDMTHSCYSPNNASPCGRCDACILRNSTHQAVFV